MHDLKTDPWWNEPYVGPVTRTGVVWLGAFAMPVAFWGAAIVWALS